MAIIDFLGEIAAISGAVCFGVGNVIIKSQGGKIKPFAINVIRLTFTGIFYLILLLSLGILTETFATMNWLNALFFAGGTFLGVVIGDMIFYFSQQLIGLSRAYPIAVSYPLLTYIIGLIFGYEDFSYLKIIGVILVIIGVYFVSISTKRKNQQTTIITNEIEKEEELENEFTELENNKNSESSITKINTIKTMDEISRKQLILGILGATATALLWTAGTIMMDRGFTNYVSPLSEDFASVTAGAFRMIVIAPAAWGLFFIFDRGEHKSKFSWKAVLLVLLAGIIGNTIGSFLYILALQFTDPSTTAAITASAPLIATPLSIIFLKEKISWKLVIGTILTITGIWLIILRPI